MKIPRAPVVLVVAALAAGVVSCTSLRREPAAPVPAPAAFSSSGEAALPDRWWRSFDDPALDAQVERALAGNLSLRSAWDRLAQAEAAARRQGADRWPTLDLEASASRTAQRRVVTDATGASRRETTRATERSLGLAAGYEIDLWGGVRSASAAAALDARAGAESLRAAAMTLSAQTASAWYALVEQYGQRDLLREQMDLNRQVLELVTVRFQRGQAGAEDVLQQRQLVESRRGDLADVGARIAVLEHQLAILTGRAPLEGDRPATTELAPLPPLPDAGVPAEMLRRRPDVRQAWYAVLAADRRAAVALADRFPRVSLAARASTGGARVDDLFRDWVASLAANLLAPLIDAGSRRAEWDRARAVLSERLHDYGQTVLDSLGEVEDALAQERGQRELLDSLERQLTLSAQVIDRMRDRYRNGAVDYLRVLDALLSHQALQRSCLQARRQLLDYRIDLCRALGGGWELSGPPACESVARPPAETGDEPAAPAAASTGASSS